ncbi:hypothetical protein EUGRSUZ_K00775 [Eucalyptus grandis]|uniref:Uncharacterized protein n=2 Tax=Eucalyptus grandis TaxID=71139 RepID=A0ACC3IRC8_EUCGR|nr:hypothetical protein EUGRSUZ_K00775 [Eucalyptus grandis]
MPIERKSSSDWRGGSLRRTVFSLEIFRAIPTAQQRKLQRKRKSRRQRSTTRRGRRGDGRRVRFYCCPPPDSFSMCSSTAQSMTVSVRTIIDGVLGCKKTLGNRARWHAFHDFEVAKPPVV